MLNQFLLSGSEIEILRFLHEFGYCEIEQIIKRFEMKKSNAIWVYETIDRKSMGRKYKNHEVST